MTQYLVYIYRNLIKPTIEGKKRSKVLEGAEPMEDELPSGPGTSVKSQIVHLEQ